jgi:hypothetical protein
MNAEPQARSALRRRLVDVYLALRDVARGRLTENQEFILFRHRCPIGPPAATDAECRVFENAAAFLRLAEEGYDIGPPEAHANAIQPFYPGGRVYALFIDKRLAHFSRVMADRRDPNFGPYIGALGSPADICIGPCETLPAFRGRGLYAAALRQICAEAGPCDAYIYCASANSASLSGIRKAGFTETGHIHRRRVLLWHDVEFIPNGSEQPA